MDLLTIDVVVKFVGAEFRKSEKWAGCFSQGCQNQQSYGQQRPQLDSAHQTGLGSMSHEPSDCSRDVSTGGQICWGGILKIGKVHSRMFFPMEPQSATLG